MKMVGGPSGILLLVVQIKVTLLTSCLTHLTLTAQVTHKMFR